jgi:hypothetical protein
MRDMIICLILLTLIQIFTPFWWWIIVVPIVCGILLAKSWWKGFRAGMLSAGLLWLGWSLYLMFSGSDIVAGRVAVMVGVNSPWLLVFVTAVLAALTAGISGGTGYLLRTVLLKK